MAVVLKDLEPGVVLRYTSRVYKTGATKVQYWAVCKAEAVRERNLPEEVRVQLLPVQIVDGVVRPRRARRLCYVWEYQLLYMSIELTEYKYTPKGRNNKEE